MTQTFKIAFIALIAGSSAAQVVTPPPGPRDPMPEYIPPTPPEEVFDTFDGLDPNLYADVQYESIVRRDENGRVLVLDRPDLEALRACTVIPDEVWPFIETLLAERRDRLIRQVATNVGSAIEIQLGAVATLNMNDPTSVQNLIQYTQPISPREPILAELARGGAVDSPTQRLAGRIYGEYQAAHFMQIDADYASDAPKQYNDANTAKAAFLLQEGINESVLIFRELCLIIANDPEGVFTEAGLEVPSTDLASGNAEDRINAVARLLVELDQGSQIMVVQSAADRLIASP